MVSHFGFFLVFHFGSEDRLRCCRSTSAQIVSPILGVLATEARRRAQQTGEARLSSSNFIKLRMIPVALCFTNNFNLKDSFTNFKRVSIRISKLHRFLRTKLEVKPDQSKRCFSQLSATRCQTWHDRQRYDWHFAFAAQASPWHVILWMCKSCETLNLGPVA